MKNKKSLLSLGLFALILVLGVGYAVVSSVDLTISGNVSANSDLKVSFTGATDTSDDRVSASSTADGLTATINVQNLAAVNDEVTATYTIQNKETDVKASISKKSITVVSTDGKNTDLSEYFVVTTSVDDAAMEIEANAEGATNTGDVTITVRLAKTPLTTETSTAKVTVVLTASPVA